MMEDADRAVRVRAMAGDIVLCSWARHFTLTVSLSTLGYRWVQVNLMLVGLGGREGQPCDGLTSQRFLLLMDHLARMQTSPFPP